MGKGSLPVFRVKSVLSKISEMKNGYQGKFKKGMTLQGTFIVTKRKPLAAPL